jgi:hypothetical protein
MKLNPFTINILGTTGYFIIVLILLFSLNFSGGDSFEFFVKTISYYFILGLTSNIFMIFIYKEWSRKYWYIILMILIFYGFFLGFF